MFFIRTNVARENESFTLPYNTSLNSVVSSLIILLCYGLKTYCTIDLHICNPRIKWLLTNLKEAFSPVKIAARVWNLTQIPDLFEGH